MEASWEAPGPDAPYLCICFICKSELVAKRVEISDVIEDVDVSRIHQSQFTFHENKLFISFFIFTSYLHPSGKFRGIWPGGVSRPKPGGGDSAPGAACSRGVPAPGGCRLQGCVWRLPPRDGYCCGRYASYWNAFLFALTCVPVQHLFIIELRIMRELSFTQLAIVYMWEKVITCT